MFRKMFFVGIVLPTLVALAWWKAPQFDPLATSFFTRSYIEATTEMPGEMRIVGWVFIGIGGLLGWVALQGVRRAVHTRGETAILALLALEVAAFGGAFFVAADSAQERIAEEHRR
jgi:hypothetical protein